MGLLGGGFFGSGAQEDAGNTSNDSDTFGNTQDFGTANTTYSSNTPISINLGKKAKNNDVNINMLDGGTIASAFGAVDDAFDAIGESQENVFLWAAGQQENTNDTALDFLDFADGETDDVLAFAAGNTELAYDDVRDSREWSAGLVGAVIGENASQLDKAYESVDNMLEWSGEFISEILDSSENNQASLRESQNVQIANMQNSYDQAMSFASGAFSKSIDTVTAAANSTRDEAANILDGMAKFTTSAVGQAGNAMQAGIAAVKDAAQSENAQLSEMVIKGGGLTAIVVVGLTLYMNRKKA